MTGKYVAVMLIAIGVVLLGVEKSAWPSVVLFGLSLVPWSLGVWLERTGKDEDDTRGTLSHLAARVGAQSGVLLDVQRRTEALSAQLTEAKATADDQQQQLSSLRSTVSLRGTLGG